MSAVSVTVETVYKPFSDHDAEAQERILEKHHHWHVDDSYWHETLIDGFKETLGIFGIEVENIFFSGFWSQGDGACFTGSYEYKKGALSEIKKEFPKNETLHGIAERLQAVQKRNFYQLTANVYKYGSGSRNFYPVIEVSHGYCTLLETIGGQTEEDIAQPLRELMDWIYHGLESEYEYLTSESFLREWFTDSGPDHLFSDQGEIL